MGTKTGSIRKLISLGLNTPDIRVLQSGRDIYDFIESNCEGWKKVSIRTDNKEGKKLFKRWDLPFFPNQEIEKAKKLLVVNFSDLIKDRVDVIVAKGINPEDALMCGKYMKRDREIVEYIIGPSTVRDVDKGIPNRWEIYGGRMPHDLLHLQLPISLHYSLFYAVEQADRGFAFPYILEFSVYPYGVGKLDKPLIFWEVIEEKS